MERAALGALALIGVALAFFPSVLWLWGMESVQSCREATDVPGALVGLVVVTGFTIVFGAIWVGVLGLASLAVRRRGLGRRTCVVLIAVLCAGSVVNLAVGVARGPSGTPDGCDVYD